MNPEHSHEKSSRKRLHRDWRLWVAVGLMLLAMLIYVLTLDESIDPAAAPPPGPGAPAQP